MHVHDNKWDNFSFCSGSSETIRLMASLFIEIFDKCYQNMKEKKK